MTADFEGDAAQDQRPEEQEDRQIVAGESRGQEVGEGDEEHSAGGDEPDFVPGP